MDHCKSYLSCAFERIFSDTSSTGFWDSANNRIHSKLIHDANWSWSATNDYSDRYGVFTNSMILLSNLLFNNDISKYKTKIILHLEYIKKNIHNFKKSDITYGVFNTLVLGQILFEKEGSDFMDEIKELLTFLRKNIQKITNNEDALILIGIGSYLNHINTSDVETKVYMNNIVQHLLKSQNKHGIFNTGDIRATYHQRTMYVLWGLAFASMHCKKDEIKKAIEKTIIQFWRKRRSNADNGLLWHPLIYLIRKKGVFFMPVFSHRSVSYLFECHQTFFVNSICFYNYFFDKNLFEDEKNKALAWIFGENRLRKNLVEITGINLPSRIMNLKGRLFIKNQQFKGSYEVGSYILALAACEYFQKKNFEH